MMRREKGSTRPPLTEAQRKAKPPVSHPIFLDAPDHRAQGPLRQPRLRDAHQRAAAEGKRRDARVPVRAPDQARIPLRQRGGTAGDVLMWDNMRTIHNAVADYRPDEPRLIKRCQVMATRFLEEPSMTNRLLSCCIAVLAGVAASTGAHAQSYPTKPIKHRRRLRRRRTDRRDRARHRAGHDAHRSARPSWSRTRPARTRSSPRRRSKRAAPDGYTLLVDDALAQRERDPAGGQEAVRSAQGLRADQPRRRAAAA